MWSGSARRSLAVLPGKSAPSDYAGRMYAIAFDLDTEALEQEYGKPHSNHAYADIEKALAPHGFSRQQGSVYFGDPERVNAVSTVVAIQDVAQQLPWLRKCVADIRMLRIEENNDLGPAIQAALVVPTTGSLFDPEPATEAQGEAEAA